MTRKATKPLLKIVEEQQLDLGPLSESYKTLERQEVVDYAANLAATETPKWAAEEAVLQLPTVNGGEVLATLATTDPNLDSEAVILRSETRNSAEGASYLLIIEGTANALIAATFAQSASVYCVPTPHTLTKEIAEGLGGEVKGQKVVLLFGTPPAVDEDAHTRATEITDTLKNAGATSVVVLLPPGNSLAAFLNPLPDPTTALENLLSAAKHIKSIKTTARQTTRPISTYQAGQLRLPPLVSTELGHTILATPEQYDDEGKPKHTPWQPFAGYWEGQKIYATTTLVNCAPVVEKVITVIDDLASKWDPTTSYQLAVQLGPAHRAITARVVVPGKELQNPMAWIDRMGEVGAEIELGEQGAGGPGGIRIAAAIKGTITHTTPRGTHYNHTGIVTDAQGVPRWVDAGGGHGPEGKTEDVAAAVLPDVSIPAASTFTNDEIKDSARAWIEAAKLVDERVWVTGLAATFLALAGQRPKAVLYYVGLPSSGKSHVTGLLASCLGPKYGPDTPMAHPEATVAATRQLIETAHNIPVWIDDVRDRDTPAKQAEQDASLELAIRAGSEGGAAIAAKQELIGSTWQTRVTRASRPFICITGEQLPNERNGSSTERLLVVDVTRATSMAEGAKEPLGEMYARRAWTPAVSAFIRERMRVIQVDHGGSVEDARLALQAYTHKRAATSLAALQGVSPRVHDVAETFLAGIIIFLDFCEKISVLTEEENRELYELWAQVIIKVTRRHAATRLNEATKGDLLLNAVKSRLASNRAVLGEGDAHLPSIGVITHIGGTGRGGKTGGVPHIALIADEVKRIAREELQIKHGVNQLMQTVTIDGRPDRLVTINGSKVAAYVIRPEKMSTDEYEETEAEAPQPKKELKWFNPSDGKYYPYE